MVENTILLFTLVTAVSSWDCEYKNGNIYKYQYNSELRNNVKEKQSPSSDIHGATFGGEVSLIPLELEKGSFFVEIFFDRIVQNNVDAMYSHILDHSTFTAIFNEHSDIIRVPFGQSVYGSNILRGVVSALKVKSCQRTGVYTVRNEVSITGEHVSTYESNTVSQLLLDGHTLFPVQESLEGLYEEREQVISTVRTVGHQPQLHFTGSTSVTHQKFLNEVIHNGTSIEYSYLMGPESIVQSCILYEEYAPNHITGYATSSHISIRATLTLVSTEKDPQSIHKLSLAEIQHSKLYGLEFVEVPLKMENVMPDLRPKKGFSEAARDLGRLVKQGYDTTSTSVLKTWLDLVRNMHAGISAEEGRQEFGRVIDHSVLPWLIDAANINGSAQLHLLAHSSIKTNRAQKLTERFIRTKQFTSNPPLRMLRWLLKTCGIERYKGACALALASSATHSHVMDPSNTNIINSVHQFLKNTIEKSSSLEERLFFVRSLENFKLAASVKYLLQIAITDGNVEMRKVAVETLFTQDKDLVTLQDREILLEKALSENGNNGAPFLHYVISTAALSNIHLLIERASGEICISGHHPLATFLHQILTDLAQSHSDQQRSKLYKEELSKLHVSCQMCSALSGVTPSDWLARRLTFGSWLLGGEIRHTRYATSDGGRGYEGRSGRTSTGTSTLSLPFLRRFGVNPQLLQTMVDLPDLSTFANDRSNPAFLHVVVDGQRANPVPFMMGDEGSTESNILLCDVSVVIPTLTGIPLTYTLTGTMRTESSVSARNFPLISQRNEIGILIQSYFNMAGAFLGWKSITDFNIKYREESDFSGTHGQFRTVIDSMHLKADTKEAMRDRSSVPDIGNIPTPTTLLNVTFSKQPQLAPYLVYCEENSLPHLSVRDALPFNSDSYLGSWFLSQPSFSSPSDTVWELPALYCAAPTILRSLYVEESTRTHVTMHVQARFGRFDWASHSRVKSVGSVRSVRFEGELEDVVRVIHGMWYTPLSGYVGSEMISLVAEGEGIRQTIGLLLYTQCIN